MNVMTFLITDGHLEYSYVFLLQGNLVNPSLFSFRSLEKDDFSLKKVSVTLVFHLSIQLVKTS